jgi:hypothetical protein
MTRDDIIRMAREAGLPAFLYPELIAETDWKLIERFAALVAAAEREACAKVCEEPGWNAANWCATQIRARGQA